MDTGLRWHLRLPPPPPSRATRPLRLVLAGFTCSALGRGVSEGRKGRAQLSPAPQRQLLSRKAKPPPPWPAPHTRTVLLKTAFQSFLLNPLLCTLNIFLLESKRGPRPSAGSCSGLWGHLLPAACENARVSVSSAVTPGAGGRGPAQTAVPRVPAGRQPSFRKPSRGPLTHGFTGKR